MKITPLEEFIPLLDKSSMLTVPFLIEFTKLYQLEADVFFWESGPNRVALEKRVRQTARNRKWKLRNLTVLHRRHKMFGKNGDFCLMVTTKTHQQFAELCNRFYRMRAFL